MGRNQHPVCSQTAAISDSFPSTFFPLEGYKNIPFLVAYYRFKLSYKNKSKKNVEGKESDIAAVWEQKVPKERN